MNEEELERQVLEFVGRTGYQPVKCRVIAKKLGLPQEEVRTLRRLVKRLVKEGRLAWGAGHYVMPPGKVKTPGRVVGVFRRTAAGNGFVRPAGTAAAAGRTKDIFIPRNRTLDAASGDTVMIRLRAKRDREGGPTGEIIEIVERA